VIRAVAIDVDRALGDTRPLWEAFLADAARRFAPIAALDPAGLAHNRAEAAAELDRWAEAGVGDWRGSLERFAEDHAPVFLRPDAEASAALRALVEDGVRLGAFTDAPEPLARIALAQLGAARRIGVLETGAGARERLLERLGGDVPVVVSRNDLVKISGSARAQAPR
jgi:phosphoglycolate phosphatase-like HAD superfamily hydrolase